MVSTPLLAQQKMIKSNNNPVYVDKQGVMRWTKNNKETAFFGVNYTVPFAYGYRSHKALGIDLEEAIERDVYHLARLGFDAFRVHIWDTEISDSIGSLLENEHLRLYDYLISKLKERNIKVFLTPIAFWGPGYPEPDYPTAGFSRIFNKRQAVTEEKAFLAQENYLKQLFEHVNPYTRLRYQDDPDIIAAEINNEPHHSGSKERASEYINRMVTAVRNTGWTKPVFYNISESPQFADAVANAPIDGVSFQWYPTGLVANHTLEGNYLPHVDRYQIPFDTIPAFKNKAKMVYEFDAGDILGAYIYPAMARSFRQAGFQWATQFAYDPLATAHANTEYQTHYVNLAYTPSKAISLMIASEAFHRLPRLKSWGTYPADTAFGVFRISYEQSLSEMNSPEAFYYSNSTRTKPIKAADLQHIAGVGSSAVVVYAGKGAYFLDKVEPGVWRLEVMPDAIHIRDPFAKAAPEKEVTRIQWQHHPIQINLADLGQGFMIQGVNEGNNFKSTASDGNFQVYPGTYLLLRNRKQAGQKLLNKKLGTLKMQEFVAPESQSEEPFVVHTPHPEVSSNKPFNINATIVGVDSTAKVNILLQHLSGKWNTIPMEQTSPYHYTAVVPAELTLPGLLSYRITIQKSENEFETFPGGHSGNPWAWNYVQEDSWQTFIAADSGAISLFNATTDHSIKVYPNLWKTEERQLTATAVPGQLSLRLTPEAMPKEQVLGWQLSVADKLTGREAELSQFKKLVIRARTLNAQPIVLKVNLITDGAGSHAAFVTINHEMQDIEIPLSSLQPDKMMLLPRPYPSFQPFWFERKGTETFNLNELDKIVISTGPAIDEQNSSDTNYSIEVEKLWIKK